MKHDVKVPAVGESIAEVIIAQWLKADGEHIEADDLICEIESDKASFEIPAEHSGVLKHLASEGDTIAVGAVIAAIEAGADAGKKAVPAAKATPAPAVKPAAETKPVAAPAASSQPAGISEIVIPAVGESITEVTIAQWLKSNGDHVKATDLICEIESDKASFEIPAGYDGLLEQRVAAGETVAIGTVIAAVTSGGKQSETASTTTSEFEARPGAESTASTLHANGSERKRVSPVAANILSEAGINIEAVKGSGPGGKITKDDAMKAIAGKADAPPVAPAAAAPATQSDTTHAATSGQRGERRERMSSLRRTIARRLVAAKNETAMLTTFNEVDMTAIKKLRSRYKEPFKERHEVGLGFMSFFAKACCQALQEWPAVNAQIDEDHIIYHDYCDISIAVSTPRGLVVPVIRNAESLSPAEVERTIVDLATRARDNKLTIEEMTGGTFTITNGGVFGSLLSTPIINQPQSAILGMHKIEDRAVVIDGQVVVRPMMYVALSYDHRIVDGRESVNFLVRVKELLEDPARIFLQI